MNIISNEYSNEYNYDVFNEFIPPPQAPQVDVPPDPFSPDGIKYYENYNPVVLNQ